MGFTQNAKTLHERLLVANTQQTHISIALGKSPIHQVSTNAVALMSDIMMFDVK